MEYGEFIIGFLLWVFVFSISINPDFRSRFVFGVFPFMSGAFLMVDAAMRLGFIIKGVS